MLDLFLEFMHALNPTYINKITGTFWDFTAQAITMIIITKQTLRDDQAKQQTSAREQTEWMLENGKNLYFYIWKVCIWTLFWLVCTAY